MISVENVVEEYVPVPYDVVANKGAIDILMMDRPDRLGTKGKGYIGISLNKPYIDTWASDAEGTFQEKAVTTADEML